MKSNWEKVQLHQIVSKLGDGLHGTPNYDENGEYYFINGNNLDNGKIVLHERTKKVNLREFLSYSKPLSDKTILLSINGTLGNLAFYNNEKIILSKSVCYLNINEDIDKNFIYYILYDQTFQNYIHLLSTGTTIRNASLKLIREFAFDLPPLNIQKVISYHLSTIDKAIGVNIEINKTMESIAQAIFKSWFIDFDPVKAKIAVIKQGGSIEEAELTAMEIISGKDRVSLLTFKQEYPEQYTELTQIASLFPSELEDSELGEVPLGWMVSEIGKEVTVIGGGTPSTQINEFWENGTVSWTTPKDLSNTYSKVLINTERKITEAGLKKTSSGLLPIDTVLMSSRAPVGYLALAKIPVAINQGYIGMKCEYTISSEYMLQWCDYYMNEIKQYASGTTFAEISKSTFKTISILVPPKNLIENFSNKVKNIYLTVENNLKEVETLSNIKDSLLPKLLNGEFRFAEIGD